MYENIPRELRRLPQWLVANKDKIPRHPATGQPVSIKGPTFCTFEEATSSPYPFIGFVLTENDPYCIIDLDDKPTKVLSDVERRRHHKILDSFVSYTEHSSGGRGYHIIVRGKVAAGVHRDGVEVYSSSRFMICTGNVVRASPIVDHQDLLDTLYAEMRPAPSGVLEEGGELLEDSAIVEMAGRAANAAKFNALCTGNMEGYPSQSEADFALLSILAFYTTSNEQVRRLFRMTSLGKRLKATRNDRYIDIALGKVRGGQPSPVNPEPLIAAKQRGTASATPDLFSMLPEGLVRDLAQYFYATATRPVQEVAVAAALAITAGVCGRSYNISGTGLNQYIILLAKTGSGKEGAATGIEQLVAAVRPTVPGVDQFIGPAIFASGQALTRVLNDKPCFVSVLGEVGLTLQQLSDQRANGAQLMLRKMLLDLYTKSGWHQVLRASVYSDTEKNTKNVHAPSVTILGESTPESFFEGLDAGQIAEGLIPRFSVLVYKGGRPERNRNSGFPPADDLVQSFSKLVVCSLATTANNQYTTVTMDHEATALLDAFDRLADTKINDEQQDVQVQLWNRAHLKSLRLAALLAVGGNPYKPTVNAAMAAWAILFVQTEVAGMAARFSGGAVGLGDDKQTHDLRKVVEGYFTQPLKRAGDRFTSLHKARIIPYAYLSQRTSQIASYRKDRSGATAALKRAVQTLRDSGALLEMDRATLLQEHSFHGVAYAVTREW